MGGRIDGTSYEHEPRVPKGRDQGKANPNAVAENRQELTAHAERIRDLDGWVRILMEEPARLVQNARVDDAGERLGALEEEVEAGLSSLGEQVDRIERIVRDIFERPEVRGLGEAPDMGSTLDQEELLSSIDRHLREAERHLVQAEKEPYQEGRGQRAASFHTGAARAHADTARAQAALLSCVA